MSWAKWAFVQKFDYTIGDYNGFWQESEVNFFVDTIKGSDSNAGTAAAPFKTLSKVKSLGTSYWKNGVVIFVNGRLNEACDINVAARIVGVGGDNGRCVFDATGNLYIKNSLKDVVIYDNIKMINYATTDNNSAFYGYKMSNSICYNHFVTTNDCSVYAYNVSYFNSNLREIYLYGNNITFYNGYYLGLKAFNASNFFANVGTYSGGTGTNRLVNTNARYFTDNSQTTPAQLLIDPANGNFNFKKNVYIWDKTAQAYITTNPLFEKGTFNTLTQKYNHIGAGYESTSYNGLNSIFIDSSQGGTATYSNIQVDASGFLSRINDGINDGIDGVLTSGIGYLGKTVKGVTILLPQTFTDTKRIIKTTPSIRVIQDIEFRWGNSEAAVNTADWCLIEYGKPIYYSLNGTMRIGNADASFDVANALIAEFSYFQFRLTFKNI